MNKNNKAFGAYLIQFRNVNEKGLQLVLRYGDGEKYVGNPFLRCFVFTNGEYKFFILFSITLGKSL